MTIQECYEQIGGDYKDVIGRLRSDRLVKKFALKFINDGSFELLKNSIAAGQWDEAFRAGHTLKGVCQNLSFTKLGESSEEITEILRAGHEAEREKADLAGLLARVEADYEKTIAGLKQLA